MTGAPARTGIPARRRVRVTVRGLVQGVGFRPQVLRLARATGVSGWVRNDGDSVTVEAEGGELDAFLDRLRREPPPLARVDALEVAAALPAGGPGGFAVRASAADRAPAARVTPDAATCPDCLAELFDPGGRRYRYPFLTCTQCGPRYTILRELPYDRARTALADFPLCADCAAEYRDPADRRFHAEAIACPACGPQLSMPVKQAAAILRAGGVLAVKGLGGFHLMCDARDDGAVARLRAAKGREAKPLAVMPGNLASARRLVQLDDAEAATLTGPDRPIVLARRRAEAPVAEGVAPGLAGLGVLLPYTPLHHLIFHEAAGRPDGTAWLDAPQDLVLVATSANLSGSPLMTDGAEVRARLGAAIDGVLDHDRAILRRVDDPLVRVVAARTVVLRRGRGQAPAPIRLAVEGPPVLALGGQLKGAICLTRGRDAVLSQHLGDLDDAETARAFDGAVDDLCRLLGARPARVAHDLHPDFHSTRAAERLGVPAVAVQHHHAHVAAVAAEHGLAPPVVGWALDGVGLGADGTPWGGELIESRGGDFRRLGRLAALPLPGGDAAARQPWRLAAAALDRLGRSDEASRRYGADRPLALLREMLAKGAHVPETTACGRWFDATAALLGIRDEQAYEAEAAMRLESLVERPRVLDGGWRIEDGVLDLWPLLAALADSEAGAGAELFHGTLAAGLVELAVPLLRARGQERIALAGGCLGNRVLAEDLVRRFEEAGVAALLPKRAPVTDGGLALGQAWVALHTPPDAARARSG